MPSVNNAFALRIHEFYSEKKILKTLKPTSHLGFQEKKSFFFCIQNNISTNEIIIKIVLKKIQKREKKKEFQQTCKFTFNFFLSVLKGVKIIKKKNENKNSSGYRTHICMN